VSDEDEYDDDDEKLSEEERKRRRLRKLLKKLAERQLDNSKKISEGFEGAYSGQENAWKYYRHHDFKYAPEPKEKIPEVKPTGFSGKNYKEPQILHQISLDDYIPEKIVEPTSVKEDLIISDDSIERIESAAKFDYEIKPIEPIIEPPLELEPPRKPRHIGIDPAEFQDGPI
jgi:hypothetical protein